MTPAPKTRILIHGHYNQRNIGDEALLDSLIKALAPYAARTPLEVAYVADFDLELGAVPGIEVHRLPSGFSGVLSYVRASDLVIFGGGSQFQDFASLARTRYLLKPLLLAFAAPRAGGVGLSLGPLRTPAGRLLARLTLGRMRCVHVRDEDSVRTARALGIQALSGKDLLLTQTLSGECAPGQGRTLIVSLLPFVATARLSAEQQSKVLDNLKSALAALQSRVPDLKVQGAAFELASDTPVLLEALPQFSAPLHGSVQTMTRGLAAADYVLATRLHSLIFAFLLKKPTLVITYHPKVEALATQLGYPARARLSPEDLLDASVLTERLTELTVRSADFLPTATSDVVGEQARFSLNHALELLLGDMPHDDSRR